MNSSSIWAIWLCQNEVLFRGRSDCTDDMVHDAGGIMASWFPNTSEGE